jgi:uncharacterized membrane protein HdeD (DUF308 family)
MNEIIQQHRSLFIFEGILFILLGILAIALPGVMTLGIELLVGWLFVIGGIAQTYRILTAHQLPGFWISLASAILSITIGVLLLAYPLTGVITLTILLIAYFFIDGIIRILLAFQLKPTQSWGWLVIGGIISIVLAGLLWAGWPGTLAWGIGLIVGINMLFFGSSLLTLALSTPKQP